MKTFNSLIALLLLTFLLQHAHSQCSPGQFYDNTTCQVCDFNTFSTTDNAPSCEPCSNCTSCISQTGNCQSCNAGEQPEADNCTACLSGTFSQGTKACATCIGCPSCDTTNGDCTDCQAGYGLVDARCSICGDLHYSPGGSSNCQACDNSCLSCSNSTGDCESCNDGFGLDNKLCAQCLSSQYTDPSTFLCQNCDDSCKTCNGGLNTNCLSCEVDFGYNETDNTCQQCADGQTSNGTTLCQDCTTSNCKTCSDQQVCEVCNDGFDLLEDKRCGFSCSLEGCDKCVDNNQTCAICMDLYTFDSQNNLCISCNVSNCMSCAQADVCETCNDEYLQQGGLCVANCSIDNCAECEMPNVCSKCDTNFTLDTQTNNTCLSNCGIDFCVDCTDSSCNLCTSTYVLVGDFMCVPRCNAQNCEACSTEIYGTCATCMTGFVLNADMTNCITCDIANCNKCYDSSTCVDCGDLTLSNGQCFTCKVDNCRTCSSNDVCSECQPGYSRISGAAGLTDQCSPCLDPCGSCDAQGNCLTCMLPYSQQALTSGSTCFVCEDPHCMICSDATNGTCTSCHSGYTADADGICVSNNCSAGCRQCSSSTVCTVCSSRYYYMQNNACVECPNIPKCLTCSATNPEICTACADGFWLNEGSCDNCPSWCKKCVSNTVCTELYHFFGQTIVYTTLTTNMPAACDPGCYFCSPVNPMFCVVCYDGFYLTAKNWCKSCDAASKCKTCSSSDSATCLTCFGGSYMTADSTCMSCTFPCTSCTSGTADSCLSCAQGYILVMSTNKCLTPTELDKQFNTTSVENCANQMLVQSSSATGADSVMCSLCNQSYVLTDTGCAPCLEGCQVCSANQLTACIQCSSGWMMNTDSICVKSSDCPAGCTSCTTFGCLDCDTGMFLNQDFMCQYYCMPPCASCSSTNPTQCTACLLGYTLKETECVLDVTCNDNEACPTCPFGYYIETHNVPVKLNQTCDVCKSASNCARCTLADTSICISCNPTMFLNGTICSSCSEGCLACANENQCLYCNYGYLPIQSGSLQGNVGNGYGSVSCMACVSPCESCQGSSYYCKSCITGFTLSGDICMSNFRYVINIVFDVTLTTFSNNYLTFLNQIAAAANVGVNNILIVSLTSGSVSVDMQVASLEAPGSVGAVNAQNSLTSLLSSSTLGGMSVKSATITTEGGSNESGGLSQTTIIILAVCIPVGILMIVGVIVAIYCCNKKKDQDSGMNEWNNSTMGGTTGRNIELTTNQSKRAYL